MDGRLSIEIGFVNDTFQAIDNSSYSEWIDSGHLDGDSTHIIMQRVVAIIDGDNNKIIETSLINNAATVEDLSNPFTVEGLTNGLYFYQKLIIPTEEHEFSSNEKLYYNTQDGHIYYIDEDHPADNVEYGSPLCAFSEIYEVVRNGGLDNCFYFDDYAFTIYDLVQCYVEALREKISDYLKNNCSSCSKNSVMDSRADILLAAINVINYLLEKKDFFEAQRILNGLASCHGLCKKMNNTLKDCGCGRS